VGGSGNANSFEGAPSAIYLLQSGSVSLPQSRCAKVWRFADAAVVGSAIMHEIEKLAGSPNLVNRVGEFVQSLLPPKQSAIERTTIRRSTSNA